MLDILAMIRGGLYNNMLTVHLPYMSHIPTDVHKGVIKSEMNRGLSRKLVLQSTKFSSAHNQPTERLINKLHSDKGFIWTSIAYMNTGACKSLFISTERSVRQ